MTWIVGIDEAGYGPNLGPLVMTAAACRLPDNLAGANLWTLLRRVVRRKAGADDDRLVIADSKVVYGPAQGLAALERGVLAVLTLAGSKSLPSAEHLLADISPASPQRLAHEVWYTGRSRLPLASDVTGYA